jgi:alkylhydroperoxidase family enzyme
MAAPPGGKPSSPTRADGVQDHEAGPRTKLIFRRAKRKYGHVPLPVRLRARDPKLLELCDQMSGYTAARGSVPANLNELAQLKVATMVGCEF